MIHAVKVQVVLDLFTRLKTVNKNDKLNQVTETPTDCCQSGKTKTKKKKHTLHLSLLTCTFYINLGKQKRKNDVSIL